MQQLQKTFSPGISLPCMAGRNQGEDNRNDTQRYVFQKKEQIHDHVIGMYIEKYYYKTGTLWKSFIPIIEDTTSFTTANFSAYYTSRGMVLCITGTLPAIIPSGITAR